jgi:hypothetical protein
VAKPKRSCAALHAIVVHVSSSAAVPQVQVPEVCWRCVGALAQLRSMKDQQLQQAEAAAEAAAQARDAAVEREAALVQVGPRSPDGMQQPPFDDAVECRDVANLCVT